MAVTPLRLALWLSVSMLIGCVAVDTNVLREGAGAPGQSSVGAEQLPLNFFQFFGSHNSYKTAIEPEQLEQLRQFNAEAAVSLEYWHLPLHEQLDLGLRVLELDVFFDPGQRLFNRGGEFPVLHVQSIDTGSHCLDLRDCLNQINDWRREHSDHEPLLISFNAKTDYIDQPGFVRPLAFDAAAWQLLDATLRESLGSAVLNPAEVLSPDGPVWPTLHSARGKVMLLLDEGAPKHNAYFAAVQRPAMFANVPETDPRAAIRVLNDPIADAAHIREALANNLLVRTRADANTLEARRGDTARRDAAFSSGAHFVSTDYYVPAQHFGTDYVVSLPGGGSVRCNPRVGAKRCRQAWTMP